MLNRVVLCTFAAASVAGAATSSTFNGAREYSTGGLNAQFVIADMNKDGIPDAVASGGEGTVLLLGLSGGKFAPPLIIYRASAFLPRLRISITTATLTSLLARSETERFWSCC